MNTICQPRALETKNEERKGGTDQMKVSPVLPGPLSLRMSTIWSWVIHDMVLRRMEKTAENIVIAEIKLCVFINMYICVCVSAPTHFLSLSLSRTLTE